LRAHRWISTGVLGLLLGMIGWTFRGDAVRVPGIDLPVPIPLIDLLSVALIGLNPLYATFPGLERTLVREPVLRAARVSVVGVLLTVVLWPSWFPEPGQGSQHANVVLFCLLLMSGLVSVVVIGELAWSVPLVLGLTVLVADNGPVPRVTRALEATPVALAVVALAAAAGMFIRWGPRALGR
jgi:hypothetical protein